MIAREPHGGGRGQEHPQQPDLPPSPAGDDAWRRLLTALYEDLRLMARRYLNRERPDHTFQPTALVHEVYLTLQRRGDTAWTDRAELLTACAQAMRRIL